MRIRGYERLKYLLKVHLTRTLPAYRGEFGFELLLVVPFAHYLHRRGMLNQTYGLKDTAPLYFFSKHHLEVSGSRAFMQTTGWNTNPFERNFRHIEWCPPNYKAYYQNKIFVYEKPLCIIHNKYTEEWEGEPVNFLDLPTLQTLFEILTPCYQVIYIRPSPNAFRGYRLLQDHQRDYELNEFSLIRKSFPSVILFQDMLETYPSFSYNQLQFMLHSNCEFFISVQGGASVVASYFGGHNYIFIKKGDELKFNTISSLYPLLSGCNVEQFHDYDSLLSTVKHQSVIQKKLRAA